MTVKKITTDGPSGVPSPVSRSTDNPDEVKEDISLTPELSLGSGDSHEGEVKSPALTDIQIDSDSSDNDGATNQYSEASDGESSDETHVESPVEDVVTTKEAVNINKDETTLIGDNQEPEKIEEIPELLAQETLDVAQDKQEETDVKEGEETGGEEKAKDATKEEGAEGGEAVKSEGGEGKEEVNEEAAEEAEETEEGAEATKSVIGEDEDWSESLLENQDPETVLDDSPARLEWLTQKREQNEKNEHLDRMMAMVGHEEVKAHFLTVKTKVEVAKRWGEDMKDLDLDLVLHGNSGTGKNKIAQTYAEFLFSIGAVPRRKFTRTTRHYMPSDAATPEETPTVVFFAKGDDINRPTEIPEILKKIPRTEENIVLILAYKQFGTESKDALKSNAEARRRFPEPIRLSNRNEKDCIQLTRRMIAKRALDIEGGLSDAVLRYLARQVLRHNKDDGEFNSIQAVTTELDALCQRQAKRYGKEWLVWGKANTPPKERTDEAGNPIPDDRPKKNLFTQLDIYGPEPTDTRNDSAAWKELQKMVGMENVKKEIADLFSIAKVNYYRGIQGKDPMAMNLNRVFLGPSGVGKTTVAELYGKILGELGLVSEGQVIMKNPTHLIGTTYGSSEDKTRKALEKAMGGVLVIDDAHMLYHASKNGENDSDIFRLAVVDTLVANVLGKAGEDRCVILVGYEDKMEQLLLKSNPGLQRRFPLDDAIRFQGYNDDQLCAILDAKLLEDEMQASAKAKVVARELLSTARRRPRFGQGGDVENLVIRAKVRQRQRLEAEGIDRIQMLQEPHPLEAIDFDPDYDRASRADGNRDALFDGFVGFDKIMKQFQGYQQMASGLRRLQIDPRTHIPWAFVFKGPPGTGKTSTARKVGQLFYDMGFLATAEVVDCSVTDLVGSWQGHTGPKVINQLEMGLGKVLFIDEAYRLAPGGPETSSVNFKNEAIGEIVDAMTKPRYAGNMVIILAGYTEEMEYLLRSNQGLRSRFPTHVTFPHMEPQSCAQLLKQQLAKLKIGLEIPARLQPGDEKWKRIYRVFAKLSVTKGWANGRDIETLAQNIIRHVFMNVGKMDADKEVGTLTVSADDLLNFLKGMLRERKSIPEDEES